MRLSKLFVASLLVFSFLLFPGGRVHAGTLPAAGCTVDPSGNLSIGPEDTCGPNYAWASATAYNGGSGDGWWELNYSYEVSGPQNESLTASVDYLVMASAGTADGADAGAIANALAQTTIGDAAGSFIADADVKSASGNTFCGVSTNTGFSGGACGWYIYNYNIQVETNTVYQITLYAAADAAAGAGASASAFAYADPSITVSDPNYSVQMSDGILNQVTIPPVPLPATAWLLLSALGALGIAGRRRLGA